MNAGGAMIRSLFWCNDPEQEDLVQTQSMSKEILTNFNTEFQRQQDALGDSSDQIKCWTQSFKDLCLESRKQRKPILAFVTKNNSEAAMQAAAKPIHLASAVREQIKEDFMCVGFTMEDTPMDAMANVINLAASGPQTQACLYFVVVTHEWQVKFLKRIDLQGEATNTANLYSFVQESSSMFKFIAEEDPHYAQVEILQNAGIIPVNHQQRRPQSAMGGLVANSRPVD